jgi:Icc-related predicted phosphoesterase
VIDRFDDVAAIVHGHAHLGPFQGHTPGGKPVYNCAAEVEKDTGRPYALIRV